MNYKELQEKREKLVVEARERLDQINGSTEEGRAKELEAQHDAAMAELDKLDANIARAQRVEAEERKMEEAREASLRSRRPTFTATEASSDARNPEDEYRAAFHAALRTGTDNLHALTAEHRAAVEARAQLAGTQTAGGYTVPTTLMAQLIETMKMYGPLYDGDLCDTIVTASGNPISFPTLDDTAHGAVAHTEGAAFANDGSGDATFGSKSLGSYVYNTPFVKISRELLDDSLLAIEQTISGILGQRLGRTSNDKLTNGSGSAEPQGVLTGASAGYTSASATGFTADELLELLHSIDPAYRLSPKFAAMMHDSTVKAIRKLKDNEGRYIWSEGNIQTGAPGAIWGTKVVVNQNMPVLAAGAKVIVAGDFGKFKIRKVGAPLVGSVTDSNFYPGVGVAGWVRFDSKVMDSTALKVLTMAAS